jgi:hypothetical protein
MLSESEIIELIERFEQDEDLSIQFGHAFSKKKSKSFDPDGIWYTVSKESSSKGKPWEVCCWEGNFGNWMERDYYDWQFATVRECLELGERFVAGKLTEGDWELRK